MELTKSMEVWVSTPSLGGFSNRCPDDSNAQGASFQFFGFEDLTSGPQTQVHQDSGSQGLSTNDSSLKSKGTVAILTDVEWNDVATKQRYQELFAKLHGKIVPGEIQKLVGSVGFLGKSESAKAHWHSLPTLLQSQLRKTQDRFFQHLIVGPEKILVGCSPELLFCKAAGASSIETVALAGTAPSSEGQKLLQDHKELQEHDWVIQSLREQSQSWSHLSKTGPKVVDLGNGLAHLKSEIKLEPTWVTDPDISEPENLGSFLVEQLHPTAALASFPPKAIKLEELFSGDQPRAHFGAPMLLEMNDGALEAWVNIRSFEIHRDGRVFFPIGAGLVQESVFEKEWTELLRKRNSLLKTLGLSEVALEEKSQ